MSINVLKRKSKRYFEPISGQGKNGFSLVGGHRNIGVVGPTNLGKSVTRTPFRGPNPMGHGTKNGKYPMNIHNSGSCCTNDPDIIKTTVKNTHGMIEKRFQGILHGAYRDPTQRDANGGYPSFGWVQPMGAYGEYSQGTYVNKKSKQCGAISTGGLCCCVCDKTIDSVSLDWPGGATPFTTGSNFNALCPEKLINITGNFHGDSRQGIAITTLSPSTYFTNLTSINQSDMINYLADYSIINNSSGYIFQNNPQSTFTLPCKPGPYYLIKIGRTPNLTPAFINQQHIFTICDCPCYKCNDHCTIQHIGGRAIAPTPYTKNTQQIPLSSSQYQRSLYMRKVRLPTTKNKEHFPMRIDQNKCRNNYLTWEEAKKDGALPPDWTPGQNKDLRTSGTEVVKVEEKKEEEKKEEEKVEEKKVVKK
jgi:hypothetical protein